mgnify:CR=1 FL=1
MTTMELLARAKAAKAAMALADTDTKNNALLAMAQELLAGQDDILAAIHFVIRSELCGKQIQK